MLLASESDSEAGIRLSDGSENIIRASCKICPSKHIKMILIECSTSAMLTRFAAIASRTSATAAARLLLCLSRACTTSSASFSIDTTIGGSSSGSDMGDGSECAARAAMNLQRPKFKTSTPKQSNERHTVQPLHASHLEMNFRQHSLSLTAAAHRDRVAVAWMYVPGGALSWTRKRMPRMFRSRCGADR